MRTLILIASVVGLTNVAVADSRPKGGASPTAIRRAWSAKFGALPRGAQVTIGTSKVSGREMIRVSDKGGALIGTGLAKSKSGGGRWTFQLHKL
jgi:hypothetical protein